VARQAAGVLASALLLRACAEIEAPWHLLLALALVPWLAALDALERSRDALLSGLAMCVVFVALVFAWFADAIAGYAGLPRAVGWAALLACAPVLEPQLLVFAWVRVRARRSLRAWGAVAWLSIAAWVACDALWPKLFADGLGTGLHASRGLRQAADLASVPGLTLAVLWVNELVWWAWRRGSAAHGGLRARLRAAGPALAGALALPLLLHVYGALRLAELAGAASEAPVRVAVVQADISHYDRMAALQGTYAAARRILDAHLEMSEAATAAAGVDWLLWPETVYPLTFGAPRSPDAAALDLEIGRLVATRGVPLLFGAYDAEADREYNAAFFVMQEDGAGAAPRLTYDVYRKSRLFPFTERLPGLLELDWVRERLPWAGAWRPGSGALRVDVTLADGRVLPVAPLICYDALDPGLAAAAARAGARVIATLSNDSWFSAGAGPRLHLVQAAFRSIETRLPQVRSTNTGISAFIDASGEIVRASNVHERVALTGDLRPRAAAVLFAADGGRWLAWALLASSAAVALRVRRRSAAPRRPSQRAPKALALLLGLLPLLGACGADRAARPPNIVLVIGDDHGWPDFGFMGSELARTPNLDRLAQEGTTFTHASNTASGCRPSLLTLLTGFHTAELRSRLGPAGRSVQLPTDVIRRFETLPGLLAQRGYATFQGGKHWEGDHTWAGFTHGMTRVEPGQRAAEPPAGGAGLALGRTTMEPLWSFLEAQRERPFFVWFAPMLPHAPFDAPAEYWEPQLDAGAAAPYLANVVRFDARVGELLARLDALGLRERTLVVYLADNGWDAHTRAPAQAGGAGFDPLIGGPRGKASLHELGFRTPLVFRWPGVVEAGRRDDRLVSSVDLFPTLLDFAAAPVPADRPGRSLHPLLTGRGGFARERVYGGMEQLRSEAPGRGLLRSERGWFLRTREWRYLLYETRGEERLYRIDRDPYETADLAAAHPDTARRLREELEAWVRSVRSPPS
jgi:apolipoprotein N-acyltransferase